ncbi:Kef-type K+ transport system membrane component KefB [Edaphobacter aggregans]|uniref:Kef-type K+ transport system membrane component KefB n=1 Tax=Edaphobacter aggregans TaxID=570835 RepID=A0A3R9QCG8_9BACT|nr:cation:proton antiporter [Edaphobacter aggregans]RSL17917.1 Kef-type K+ transport system membrane component KefB [Edaphobacter aggregans]
MMGCPAGGFVGEIVLVAVQIAMILAVTKVCGWVLGRVGQPRVVGEIAGGLLLGPLVFGHYFPAASARVFPPGCLQGLEMVSYVGLVLFLMMIGAEVDTELAGGKGSLAITVGSIAVPFVLGVGLAGMLPRAEGVSRVGFVLFVGIAMSITALPVLARIIQERRGTGRAVDPGTASIALVCAAGNDVAAWALLAVILEIVRGGGLAGVMGRLALLAGFVGVMLFGARPMAARVAGRGPLWVWVVGIVAVAFVSARVTEMLGVHAFFGAFLAGVCVPWTKALEEGSERVLQPLIAVGLPLFFAMTGLRAQREMFSQSAMGWLAVVLVVAVVGKVGGSALGARVSGMSWRSSAEIGVLMNTRGLVELVVLNIGYREGILSPLLFTVFVLMAVVTTAMTVPGLGVVRRVGLR